MPFRNEVVPLRVLGENTFSEHFARSWEEYWINGQRDGRFLQILRFIPHCVANTIIVKILKFYINNGSPKDCRICDLLAAFSVVDLTILDLTSLVKIGSRDDDQIKLFERTVLTWLPDLRKLTTLNLKTHSLQTTLPICSDDLLQGIGSYLKNLRVLDISGNNLVTDYGLEYLLPCNGSGCPLLEEIFVFDCSVTVEGIAYVVENLCNLRMVGYKEMGEVMKYLHKKLKGENSTKLQERLKLTHINNLGSSGFLRFECNMKLIDAMTSLCPKLLNLKVRVTDKNVPFLQIFDKLKVLELFYYEKIPLIHEGSASYFRISGHQLYSLSLTASTFYSRYFLVIGEGCLNLQKFWFTCYSIILDLEFDQIQNHDVFRSLDTLYFRIGFSESETHELSLPIFKYILQNTSQLSDLRIISRSPTLTDLWLKRFWKCFKTGKLVKVLIALPYLNVNKKSLPLTMLSVNLILEQSPCLQYLGNLLVWDITYQEVKNLKTYLNMCNFNVNLVYHQMKIK
ncbi:hypothetical protein R5R35_002232 [Gryllus longicercus]|uniref:Uncharacterized protein n=1 Tax=Gryllus longicercus TaxID=2509291 RepID=A0AAN9VW10_9ORTH